MRKCLISGVILLFLFSSLILSGYESEGIGVEIPLYWGLDIDGDGSVNQYDKDDDADGLSDSWEYETARHYSPVLIFDDDEPCDVIHDVVIPYQVSPITVGNDEENYILLSFVVMYPEDYGAKMDWSWWQICKATWWVGKILGPEAAAVTAVTMVVSEQFNLHEHCGDTEAIYFLLHRDNKRIWDIEKVIWKRHYDDPYYGDESIGNSSNPLYAGSYTVFKNYEDFKKSQAVNFTEYKENGLHPIIFVSKKKHAMYPTKEEGESYKSHIKIPYTDISIPKDLLPTFEKCGGGIAMPVPTPMELNVGEDYARNTKALYDTKYYYTDPWSLNKFYGQGSGIICGEGGAGGVGGKWLSLRYIRDLSQVPSFGAGHSGQGIEIEIP